MKINQRKFNVEQLEAEALQPIQVNIAAGELLMVLGTMQLGLRHPQCAGPPREVAERTLRVLIEGLRTRCPESARLLELGQGKG